MAESALLQLVGWLREERHSCYVLLPRSVYLTKVEAWNLPGVELLHSVEK